MHVTVKHDRHMMYKVTLLLSSLPLSKAGRNLQHCQLCPEQHAEFAHHKLSLAEHNHGRRSSVAMAELVT
jgi:hypothetical protein